MSRPIVLGVAALLLFALGFLAANTHVARGVIFPVTSYEADVNKDTRVNVADLGLVASKYGQIAPTATYTPTATATTTPMATSTPMQTATPAAGGDIAVTMTGCELGTCHVRVINQGQTAIPDQKHNEVFFCSAKSSTDGCWGWTVSFHEGALCSTNGYYLNWWAGVTWSCSVTSTAGVAGLLPLGASSENMDISLPCGTSDYISITATMQDGENPALLGNNFAYENLIAPPC